MRELACALLKGKLSRRQFVRAMTAVGFTAASARSAIASLAPVMAGQGSPVTRGRSWTRPFVGSGGELVAEQVAAAGTRFIFVCNSSGMGALSDALVDRPQLQFIQGVSEHQVMAIADGYAKASGQTAFAGFSRVGGPLAGANMYNAMKDRTPIVAFTDNANSTSDGRDGHEDVEDWLEPFEQYTKWRWLVKEEHRIPEWLTHAFKVASTAPCGPTFVRVPRNLLYRRPIQAEIFAGDSMRVPMKLRPAPDLVEAAADMLIEARNPILYLGVEVGVSGARPEVVKLAELLGIPATQARSWLADFPTDHPLYLGEYRYPMRFPGEIDLFLNLGAHMPDPGGSRTKVPRNARIIHARIENRHIGNYYPTDLALVGDVRETTLALIEAIESKLTRKRLEAIRDSRRFKLEADAVKLQQSFLAAAQDGWDSSPVTWPRLLLTLNRMLDPDAVIVDELGTENWVLRSFPFADGKKTKIGRTIGRALGWGVGASVGVKLARPNQQVVCLQGDGGFLFGQSDALWSMSRYDVPVITIIGNNQSYDEPRNNMLMRQGRAFEEKKDMICYLGSPDVEFSRIAEAYGIDAERVDHPDQLANAIGRAIRTTREGRPYLLDVRVARTGLARDSTWFPGYSVANTRTRKV